MSDYPLDPELYPPNPGPPVPADAGPGYSSLPTATAPFLTVISCDEPQSDPYSYPRTGEIVTDFRTLEYALIDTTKLPVFLDEQAAYASLGTNNVGRLYRIQGSTAIHVMLPHSVLVSEGII